VQAAGDCSSWFSLAINNETCQFDVSGFCDGRPSGGSFPALALDEVADFSLVYTGQCTYGLRCLIKKTANPKDLDGNPPL
jgi:hypothetical protein